MLKGNLPDVSERLLQIQPPYVLDIPTHYIHIIQSCHHLWHLASLGAINLTISHIISFHSFPCRAHGYCFLQLSPATSNFKKFNIVILFKNKTTQILI